MDGETGRKGGAGGWHHSLSHQGLRPAAVVWGSGSARTLGCWDCQNCVLGDVLFQEKPSFPVPCTGPFRCAAYLCLVPVGHSVGTGTQGGLHPGPIQNSALAPAAAAQRCLQGK